MEMIYLSRKHVEDLDMTMKEVLAAVDNGFRLEGLGKTEMPPKPGIHPRPNAFIHAMPAYVQEVESAGLKWVGGYPSNPDKGLPYITGLLVLNDPATGIPIAVMDCAWITAMRTGASAGIAAKYLACPDSRTAGILGCGVQARTSLMALVEPLPPTQGNPLLRCVPGGHQAVHGRDGLAVPETAIHSLRQARRHNERCRRGFLGYRSRHKAETSAGCRNA